MTTQLTQLNIPDRIKVGFVKRDGTYTGKLAYVIYFDKKGVLRKETSWEGWRDKKITPVEFTNEPTEGFVLNKGVGGQRHSYGWNARNEYIRVYDPRDFEFEISVANLLFILRECDCNKGKGLEGKFVYAWDGKELVLLPVTCQEYTQSKDFSALQGQSVKAKEMIAGASYLTKKQDVLIYLGKMEYFYAVDFTSYPKPKDADPGMEKRHIFWNEKEKRFVPLSGLTQIASLQSDAIASNFAELVEAYGNTGHASRVTRLFVKELKNQYNEWYREENGRFFHCTNDYRRTWDSATAKYLDHELQSVTIGDVLNLENNRLCVNYASAVAYPPGKEPTQRGGYYGSYGYSNRTIMKWVPPVTNALYVELENGKKLKYSDSAFKKSRG